MNGDRSPVEHGSLDISRSKQNPEHLNSSPQWAVENHISFDGEASNLIAEFRAMFSHQREHDKSFELLFDSIEKPNTSRWVYFAKMVADGIQVCECC